MAHIYNSGVAIVNSNPNDTTSLQSGHKVKVSVLEDGTKMWRYVSSNPSGQKWVEIDSEIGGRNYLLDSGVVVSNTSYLMRTYTMSDKIKNNEKVTITIWGKLGAGRSSFMAYKTDGGQLGHLKEIETDVWRGTFTFTNSSNALLGLRVYQYPSSGISTSTVNKIKFETGQKGSDWTPSPEDLVSDFTQTNTQDYSFIKNVPSKLRSATNTDVTNWDNAYAHSTQAHAPSNAQKNVQSDWNATSGDAHIKNRPVNDIAKGVTAHGWGDHSAEGYLKSANLNGYATQSWSNGQFEPKFSKNTAFNKNLGTTAGTVARGDDSRFHTHSNKGVLDGISSTDVINWNDAFNGKVSSVSVTGTENKVLTITKEDGTTLTANFSDVNHPNLPDDVLNTLTFNDANGNLIAVTSEGITISANIDGRYSLIGHVHSWSQITGKPSTFPPSSHTHANLVAGTGLSGPTYNGGTARTFSFDTVWGDARYLGISGQSVDSDKLDGQHGSYYLDYNNFSNTPTIPSLSGYATQSWANGQFDKYNSWNLKTNGVQRTTITSGGDLDLVAGNNVSLSYGAGGKVTINATDTNTNTTYSAGTNISITGASNQISLSGSIPYGNLPISSADVTKWNTAYGWGNHADAEYVNQSWANGQFEPKFTKNNAFNKTFGAIAGTVAQGNDSRFHTHSNMSVLQDIAQGNINQWNIAYNNSVSSLTFDNKGLLRLTKGSGHVFANVIDTFKVKDVRTNWNNSTGSASWSPLPSDGQLNNTVKAYFGGDWGGDDTWGAVLNVKGWEGSYASWQLGGTAHMSDNDKNLYFRTGSGNTWRTWRKVVLEDTPIAPDQVTVKVTTNTSNNLNMGYPAGNLCNMASANAITMYYTYNSKPGGQTRVRINAASEPAVSGGTKLKGSSFIANTDMYLEVRNNGVRTEYWFEAM